MAPPRAIVALLTDFGGQDHYAGAVRGAVLSACPDATVVDVCHELPPHDVQAGAFALVVECVPAEVAKKITAAVKIPTIGIGAGADCDGQILVTHDLLGLFNDLQPRFVKQYADLGLALTRAVEEYCREVREGIFPAAEHEFR